MIYDGDKCETECGDGYWEDDDDNTCKECNSNCEKCYGPNSYECKKCNAHTSWLDLPTDTCTLNCPAGYHEDNATWTCIECVVCATCEG